jgi:hypothetical protein
LRIRFSVFAGEPQRSDNARLIDPGTKNASFKLDAPELIVHLVIASFSENREWRPLTTRTGGNAMFQRTKLLGATLGASIGIVGFVSDAAALPTQATFTDAGLGLIGSWTLVGNAGDPELFGTGGNGFFSSGGLAEFELRLANDPHRFGTALTSHGGLTTIFDTNVVSVGATASFAAPANPYLFFFQNLCTNCSGDDGLIFSDQFRQSDPLGQLDMAIYQQGGTFAFFFDDGGPAGGSLCGILGLGCNDDNDYNEMVVTVSARAVPEPMTLSMLGAGLFALGYKSRRRRS